MEEEKNKKETLEEDFSDFDDLDEEDNNVLPEIDEDLIEEETTQDDDLFVLAQKSDVEFENEDEINSEEKTEVQTLNETISEISVENNDEQEIKVETEEVSQRENSEVAEVNEVVEEENIEEEIKDEIQERVQESLEESTINETVEETVEESLKETEQEQSEAQENNQEYQEDFKGEFEYETMQIDAFQNSLDDEIKPNIDESGNAIPWPEDDDEDSAVKKYIFYVSKDFVPYLDNLTTDQRSAYINDAIQIKIDLSDSKRKKELGKKALKHLFIMFLTICFSAPVVLLLVHKSIMATFNNYKYTQDSFEKLYRQRFAKDKAYMRSIQYNREMQYKKNKTH